MELEIGIGLYCALIPLLLTAASSLYLAIYHSLGLSSNAFSVVQFLIIFALLLVPAGYLFGGVLIRVATNRGVLVIECGDPQLEVSIKEGTATVYDKVKERLKEAEKLARGEKLGIWAHPELEPDHNKD